VCLSVMSLSPTSIPALLFAADSRVTSVFHCVRVCMFVCVCVCVSV